MQVRSVRMIVFTGAWLDVADPDASGKPTFPEIGLVAVRVESEEYSFIRVMALVPVQVGGQVCL